MALKTAKGVITASTTPAATTAVDLSASGFASGQPLRAVIFFTASHTADADVDGNGQLSIGWATNDGGTIQQAYQAWEDLDGSASITTGVGINTTAALKGFTGAGTVTVDFEMDVTTFSSTGFTVTWTDAPANAIKVHYLALGGDEITAARSVNWQVGTAAATQDVTVNAAFGQPDVLLTLNASGSASLTTLGDAATHGQLCLAAASDPGEERTQAIVSYKTASVTMGENSRPSGIYRMLSSSPDAGLQGILVSKASWPTDGFRVEWHTQTASTTGATTTPATAAEMITLAIKGTLSAIVGSGTIPTAAAPQANTHSLASGTAKAAVVWGGTLAGSNVSSETAADLGGFFLGATDGTNEGSVGVCNDDANTDSRAGRYHSEGKAYRVIVTSGGAGPVLQSEADSALSGTDLTLTFTDTDSVARTYSYLIFGETTTPAVVPEPVYPSAQRSTTASADRLHIVVTHADGRTTRWGPGEQTDRLLNDLTFSSSSPGGDKEASCSLLRDLQQGPDEGLLDRITIYGPGGRIVWLGRVLQLPRETGDTNRMSPQAVGYSAHLSDMKSFREIYVDRDLSRWGSPSLGRRLSLLTTPISLNGFSHTVDRGVILCALPNEALGAQVISELWYNAPAGCLISKLGYKGTLYNLPGGWTQTLYSASADDATGAAGFGTLDGTQRTTTLATARRYIFHQVYSAGTAATPAVGAHVRIENVAVYGDHGLTLQTISGEPSGIYVSDIIADVIGRAAPDLAYTTGTDGTIQANTFVVPQAAFPDFTTAADVVAQMNKYAGWDWLVYAGPTGEPTFYFQQAGSGTEWRSRRADGAKLRLDGQSSDVIVNKMYVIYDDGTGIRKTAGPVGSGCDVEDATLEDTSAENPVNSHDIDEKSDTITLSDITNEAGAIAIGSVALLTRNAATRRGQITVTGTVEHPQEGQVPVWRVKAGDSIIVGDVIGDVARRIIEVGYNHQARTATLTLDNTPGTLEAIIERLGIATQAFVQ